MDDPGSTCDEPLEPPSPATGAGTGGDGVSIDVIDPQRRLAPADLRWLEAMSRCAAGALGTRGEARVRIVGDDEMAHAHHRYKGVEGTTDVLTFDLADGAAREMGLDVDILICADEAARQASGRGQQGSGGTRHELLLYIVHGILHCLGYDDGNEADAAAMHAREDEILTAIGVGPVYAQPAPAATGAGGGGCGDRAGGGQWA